jgi:hypothetical protein
LTGAVGVAGEGEDLGVVDEAVDHGGGDDVVGEGLAPAAEGQVRGDHDRALFVAGGDELEEQVRRVVVEGDVADLVDLCGCPHRSTYADTATMPRGLGVRLVKSRGELGFLGVLRCHVSA